MGGGLGRGGDIFCHKDQAIAFFYIGVSVILAVFDKHKSVLTLGVDG